MLIQSQKDKIKGVEGYTWRFEQLWKTAYGSQEMVQSKCSAERNDKKAHIELRPEVTEVAEAKKRDEKESVKYREECDVMSICPWNQASRSNPAGERALAGR